MDNPSGTDLSASTLTGAPPPPQEVKVRTMASDLASMTASGGGMPRFENVKITSVQDAAAHQGAGAKKTSFIVAVVCIAAVLLVLIGGYFAYRSLQKKIMSQPSSTAGQ